MRSFAIWYKKKNDNDNEAKVDIHINLWESKICSDDDSRVYIDFGLMFYDINLVDELYIYCPFNVDIDNVEDVGHRIIENDILVGAIFNDNYHAESGIPRRLIITPDNKDKDPFTIYELDTKNDLSIKKINQEGGEVSHGSLLTFLLKDILDGKYGKTDEEPPTRYYFRIRISSNLEELSLMFQEAKNISPFQDAFVITQVVDFRLNNLRSCNRFIRDRIAKGDKFKIMQIHYLLLRKATDVFIHQGEDVSSRLLEKPLWKKYIDGLNENVIAYHFKKKSNNDEGIEDFCVLSRFEYQQLNKKKLIAYTYLVVFLGVVSGLIANYLPQCPYVIHVSFTGVLIFIAIIWWLRGQ
jgi:hypothetical protein